MHIYIHIFIYIYIHTCIYTHIYIYTCHTIPYHTDTHTHSYIYVYLIRLTRSFSPCHILFVFLCLWRTQTLFLTCPLQSRSLKSLHTAAPTCAIHHESRLQWLFWFALARLCDAIRRVTCLKSELSSLRMNFSFRLFVAVFVFARECACVRARGRRYYTALQDVGWIRFYEKHSCTGATDEFRPPIHAGCPVSTKLWGMALGQHLPVQPGIARRCACGSWHVHICAQATVFGQLWVPAWEKMCPGERLNTCDPNSRSLSSLAARSIPLLCEATLAQALRESELGLPVMIRAQPCHRQQEDDLNVCRDWKLSYHWTYNSFIRFFLRVLTWDSLLLSVIFIIFFCPHCPQRCYKAWRRCHTASWPLPAGAEWLLAPRSPDRARTEPGYAQSGREKVEWTWSL